MNREPRIDFGRRFSGIGIAKLLFVLAADGGQFDALAVDADFHLVQLFQALDHVGGGSPQPNFDHVLAVQREIVANRQPAARSQRQAFHVAVLGKIGLGAIRRRVGFDVRIAHRQPAQVPGSRHVAFQQRRRSAQNIRDIVEPIAFIVGGEQRRGIYVQGKQIVDCVSVLGAIQPVQRRASRVRMRRGCLDRSTFPATKPSH